MSCLRALAIITLAAFVLAPLGLRAQDAGKDVGKEPAKPQAAQKTEAAKTEAAPAAPAAASQAAGDLVPLKIELPKPMFVGTPKNIRSPNLEPQTGKARSPFMVPKGVELLSRLKPVTASDKEPIIGDTKLITDSDKEGADGSYVEFGPGAQWVQVDLGAVCEVYAIVMWHYHGEARVYHDVVVRTADDPDFVTNVQTIFNNDHDNSSGLGVGKDKEYIEVSEGKLIDAKGIKTRYLRFFSNGNTSNEMNHYIEIEVYGKPAAK